MIKQNIVYSADCNYYLVKYDKNSDKCLIYDLPWYSITYETDGFGSNTTHINADMIGPRMIEIQSPIKNISDDEIIELIMKEA